MYFEYPLIVFSVPLDTSTFCASLDWLTDSRLSSADWFRPPAKFFILNAFIRNHHNCTSPLFCAVPSCCRPLKRLRPFQIHSASNAFCSVTSQFLLSRNTEPPHSNIKSSTIRKRETDNRPL